VSEEKIDHPKHYTSLPAKCANCGYAIECIDVTEHLGFSVGNAVKYIWRAGRKSPDVIEDLKKAAWYIAREIERLSKAKEQK